MKRFIIFLLLQSKNRDRMIEKLSGRDTLRIHYPVPNPNMNAFPILILLEEKYPNAETQSEKLLSLPMHPNLSQPEVEEIVGNLS